MERSNSMANRLREVLLDGYWIANTNYRTQLESISWEQATRKIGNLNTIAALTYHINYYLAGLITVFDGGALEIRDKHSFDLPPLPSPTHWTDLIHVLSANAEKFAAYVEKMTDEKLDAPFVDPKYGTYARNIEGVIEHAYYHLGQISLLKKLITESQM